MDRSIRVQAIKPCERGFCQKGLQFFTAEVSVGGLKGPHTKIHRVSTDMSGQQPKDVFCNQQGSDAPI